MAPKRVSSSGGSSLEASAAKRGPPHPAAEEEESDPEGGWETEEEELVHVELSGTFQDDIGRQPGILTKLVGLDTERPIVQIGGQVRALHFVSSVVRMKHLAPFHRYLKANTSSLPARPSSFVRPTETRRELTKCSTSCLPSRWNTSARRTRSWFSSGSSSTGGRRKRRLSSSLTKGKEKAPTEAPILETWMRQWRPLRRSLPQPRRLRRAGKSPAAVP